MENQTLEGSWKEKTNWKSSWCSQAFYSYDVGLKGILDDVKLGLQEDGRGHKRVEAGPFRYRRAAVRWEDNVCQAAGGPGRGTE